MEWSGWEELRHVHRANNKGRMRKLMTYAIDDDDDDDDMNVRGISQFHSQTVTGNIINFPVLHFNFHPLSHVTWSQFTLTAECSLNREQFFTNFMFSISTTLNRNLEIIKYKKYYFFTHFNYLNKCISSVLFVWKIIDEDWNKNSMNILTSHICA
jgi:hypothetical protein